MPVRIVATSDVHSPKHLDLLGEAVDSFRGGADLVVTAGDLVERGDASRLGKVLDLLETLGAPIYGVFGNEEYDQVKPELVDRYAGRIRWLDDEAVEVRVGGEKIWLVGTRGSLARPTSWQARNVPGIAELYERRISLVDDLLSRAAGRVPVLITHYSPTYRTLVGEDRRKWPFLGHPGYERVIRRRAPAAVIHGHAHAGSPRAMVGGVPVYNVALPLNRSLVVVEVGGRRGLEAFL